MIGLSARALAKTLRRATPLLNRLPMMSMAGQKVPNTVKPKSVIPNKIAEVANKLDKSLEKELTQQKENIPKDDETVNALKEKGWTVTNDGSLYELKKKADGKEVIITFTVRSPSLDKDYSDSKEAKEGKQQKEKKECEEGKEEQGKEKKECKEEKTTTQCKEAKDGKDGKEGKEVKKAQEGKEAKQEKETKKEDDQQPDLSQFSVYVKKPGSQELLVAEYYSSGNQKTLTNVSFTHDYLSHSRGNRIQNPLTKYYGPQLDALDQALLEDLEDYMESLGVDNDIVSFVTDYSVRAEHPHYVKWLEDLRKFIR